VPSSDGDDLIVGLELHTGLPWSGYVYHPDFCSMLVYDNALDEVVLAVERLAAVAVVEPATSTVREADNSTPFACIAFTVST
jgi:hypothetical protein